MTDEEKIKQLTEQVQQLKLVVETYKRLLGIGEELPPWRYIDDDEDLDDT